MRHLMMILRRIAAFLYDSLLLIAMYFVVTFALVMLNDGERIDHALFYPALWIIAGLFFVFFWERGGQTLGMRAWHLVIEDMSATASNDLDSSSDRSSRRVAPTIAQLLMRYLAGSLLFGITYIWMWVDRNGLAAHDRLSGTRISIDSSDLKSKS